MAEQTGGEQLIAAVSNAPGIILAVTENGNWIEVFFDGDLMHTQTVNLPPGGLFSIYVEETSNKTTVPEHPRTMIFFCARRSARYARWRARHCHRRRQRQGCLLKAPPVP